MTRMHQSQSRLLIVPVALIAAVSLVSCAGRSRPHGQDAETLFRGEYTVLTDKEPPFRIDTEEDRPFSRWNVPWDDDDNIALEIVWLRSPSACSSLPEFALVINKYSVESKGLLCLVDKDGAVRSSICDLGMIQRIRAVAVAPIREPQLLVYTNPGHGSGSFIGETVLFAVARGRCRVLLQIPRYEYYLLEGDNYSLGLPIVVGKGKVTTRIAIPAVQVTHGPLPDAPESCAPRFAWGYSEFEWDRKKQVFRPATSPASACLFSPDAWTWTPDYDVGGEEDAGKTEKAGE